MNELLSRLQEKLPSRKLTLSNAGDGGWFFSIVLGVSMCLATVALLYATLGMAKDIIKDRRLVDNSIVLENANAKVDCDSLDLSWVIKCDVNVVHQGRSTEKNFTFIDWGWGEYESIVLVQKDDPANINVQLAVQKTFNRVITLLVLLFMAFVALAWGVSVLRAIPKKQRLKNIMNDEVNQPWQFVSVSVQQMGDLIIYATRIDGEEKTLELNFQGRKPIILDESGGQIWVLAFKAATVDTSVIVCRKFKNIDLKKSEKKDLIACLS